MIKEINKQNLTDINKPNQPFDVIGKIVPVYQDGHWSYTECLFDEPYEKRYDDDDIEPAHYINNPERIIYFCYDNNECVGQIELVRNWNKYALVADIAVAQKSRGKGVGVKLIKKAIEWAKEKGLCGLVLETQDNNLLACRFYSKMGFKIGAVDTMLYANFDNAVEKAVFWYMRF